MVMELRWHACETERGASAFRSADSHAVAFARRLRSLSESADRRHHRATADGAEVVRAQREHRGEAPLHSVSQELQQRFPDSEWAVKASVWASE
jgi:hypothetical protein